MAFLSCGGAWSMHLGLHSQHISKCTLPQARAHGQTNRLLALQCRTLGRRVAESELFTKGIQFVPLMGRKKFASCVCLAGGPRPRKPRIWKSRVRKGTVAKGDKLLECIKALSNVKEEVYGALDSFIAWEVEFPLIAVKKALKALEAEKEWKRVIQVAKWMLSKGQGKTMGTYYLLLGALAEDGRIEEAEELWSKIFKRHLEYVPRRFFSRVIIMYDRNNMPEKLLEVFADMEELGVKPDYPTVIKVANTLKKMGMLDKYDKVLKKYPPPKWEYRYDKRKRIKVRVPARHVSGEELIPLNDNSSNNLDEDDSVVDALITAEGTEQQTEVSQSLEETDLTRVPVST